MLLFGAQHLFSFVSISPEVTSSPVETWYILTAMYTYRIQTANSVRPAHHPGVCVSISPEKPDSSSVRVF